MALRIPKERLGNVALDEHYAVVDIAIGLYKRHVVSLGRAAEVAGIIVGGIAYRVGTPADSDQLWRR